VKELELEYGELLNDKVLVVCDDDCAMVVNVLNIVLDVVYVLLCEEKVEVLAKLVARRSLERLLGPAMAGLAVPFAVCCELDGVERKLVRLELHTLDEICKVILPIALAEEEKDWGVVSVLNMRDLNEELTAELQAAPP